jgi:hypothetical protein
MAANSCGLRWRKVFRGFFLGDDDEGGWDCMGGVGAWARGGTDVGFAFALHGVGGPAVVVYSIASRCIFVHSVGYTCGHCGYPLVFLHLDSILGIAASTAQYKVLP